jgi:hypothetical protein
MSESTECYRQLERISKSMNVRKSFDTPALNCSGVSRDKVLRAIEISKACETPEGAIIAKRIIALQNQKVMRAQYAPFLKNMPGFSGGLTDNDTFNRYQETARRRAQSEDEDDEWPCHCENVNEDDLLAELKETREREAELIELIRELRRA